MKDSNLFKALCIVLLCAGIIKWGFSGLEEAGGFFIVWAIVKFIVPPIVDLFYESIWGR